jgi:phosphoserine phosphatase
MTLETPPERRVRWPEFSHVIFDCDSTLSSVEGIDFLARSQTLDEAVTALTDAAMAGDVDLTDVYAARLNMLQPSRQAVAELRSAYKRHIVTGAREVIEALHEIGTQVYIVSGGLAEPVEDFAVHLGIDVANVRAVAARHDSLSGDWWKSGHGRADETYAGFEGGALTRSDGKAEIIASLLEEKPGLSMLVGDGASDLSAADAVDLFVGFGGVVRRERVAAEAPVFIDTPSLAPVLPIAAGPGGRQRLTTAGSQRTFAEGTDLISAGRVSFRNPDKKDQLMTALNG